MNTPRFFVLTLLLATVAGLTLSQNSSPPVEKVVQAGGSGFAQDMKQDPDQALCSLHRNSLTGDVLGGFIERQRATLKYPADNKLFGNWKEGEKLFIEVRKGNCYACHTADPREKGAGRMGPSLTAYGDRGTSEAVVTYTYEKIYNAWAFQPCSLMYRGGYHGILSPEETAHITAFLLDPASPVNAKR